MLRGMYLRFWRFSIDYRRSFCLTLNYKQNPSTCHSICWCFRFGQLRLTSVAL